jgi:hypothetical protein
MITLTNENNTIGSTYSNSNYLEYKENKNIFEEVIDALMLDQYSDEPELTNFIKSLPSADKRMAILSLLDSDNNMWIKLKSLIENNNISKVEQIKDVVLMLREYVKIAEVEKKKFGEVMTPLELVKEMLATLPEEVWSNPDLKWLDPANGTGPYPIMVIYKLMKGLSTWEPNEELRYRHIIENMIYVCELQPKNMFLYLCAIDPKDEYKCNVYTGSFLDEGFDKHMIEIWKVIKFDIVIGNPPYQSYTHMKFINKSIDMTNENGFLCILHPSQQFLDIKPKTTSKDELTLILNVQKYETIIYLINGNLLFDIEMFFTPLSITLINKRIRTSNFLVFDRQKKLKYIYPSIKEVNLLGWSEEYISLKDKILSFVNKNGHIKNISKREGNFYVGISEIRGHACKNNMFKTDFYTILPIISNISTEPKSKHFNAGFETKEDSINFELYLKTKFARFCLALYKINSTLAGTSSVLNAIPMVDFNNYNSDEKLTNLFKFSKKECEFIESIIPNFYPDEKIEK